MARKQDSGYVLSEDSQYDSIVIDEMTVNKTDPVVLTDDQVERGNAIEGVELVSAEQKSSESGEE